MIADMFMNKEKQKFRILWSRALPGWLVLSPMNDAAMDELRKNDHIGKFYKSKL